MKKVEAPHGIYLLDNTPEEVCENFQDAVKEIGGGNTDSLPDPLDILGKAADTFKSMVDSHCEQCAHYHADAVYDWCHECMMECDHFEPKDGDEPNAP